VGFTICSKGGGNRNAALFPAQAEKKKTESKVNMDVNNAASGKKRNQEGNASNMFLRPQGNTQCKMYRLFKEKTPQGTIYSSSREQQNKTIHKIDRIPGALRLYPVRSRMNLQDQLFKQHALPKMLMNLKVRVILCALILEENVH